MLFFSYAKNCQGFEVRVLFYNIQMSVLCEVRVGLSVCAFFLKYLNWYIFPSFEEDSFRFLHKNIFLWLLRLNLFVRGNETNCCCLEGNAVGLTAFAKIVVLTRMRTVTLVEPFWKKNFDCWEVTVMNREQFVCVETKSVCGQQLPLWPCVSDS